MASKTKAPKTKPAKNYRHPESESPMRPEVGTQAQFKKRLPPEDLPLRFIALACARLGREESGA